MKKIVFLYLPSCCGYLSLISQNELSLRWERQSDRSYVFYCENRTYAYYTINITFNRLKNLSLSGSNPFSRVVKPGTTRLLRLRYVESSIQGDKRTDFDYKWSYYKGCERQLPDTNIVYLLPVSPGKKTSTIPLKPIARDLGYSDPKDYYAVGFTMNAGDTIYSARRGRVVEIVDDQVASENTGKAFSAKINEIEIIHDDCSFADYELFKRGKIFVNEEDWVEAGTPLGIVGAENFSSGPHMRFHVRYSYQEQKIKDNKPVKEKNYWAYVKTRF